MNEFESDWISLSQSFVQNGWIQDGRIQDGCHHQINQIELVWVRFRLEWECFWVNLREDNKVSESKMAVSESKMADFKMADIIKLGKNEWVWVRLNWFESGRSESVFEWIWKKITRCPNSRWTVTKSTKAEFKMAAIIKLSQNEWVKCFCAK